ncbi:efflux RND transporter periplasmic adaptor subunit [Loktanella sp. M215]|uniref:efflux RND transporter periplasmic adaptor subunit n=1 Tax=Loktanella sp. M215 TaxID=2675431 RepID=UPI001F0278EC|nr:efflux RND transporter periplasmic adaptor subunit [Loktanella sp. M215]MCF7698486.1 efflux RND transporter periplasmic adaptor subunit [Loktanella sp. M215]
MSLFKQCLIGLVVLGIALAAWIAYVPSARGLLERAGVTDLLGIAPQAAAASAAPAGPRGGGGAARVISIPVAMGVLDDRVSAIGDAQAIRSVTVRSEAAGLVRRVAVDDGGVVAQGDILAELDDDAQQIAVSTAQVMLDDAQAELARQTQLRQTGASAAVTFQAAQLAVQTAELAVRQADYDLSQRTVRAPIAGRIGLLSVEEGARIATQDPIGVITDQSQMLIAFSLPERVIGQLSVGQTIRLTPLARPDQTLEGRIRAIDNVVDLASRTLRVQGVVANDDDMLRSGMSFRVDLAFEGDPYPVIDPLALQWSNEGSYVWAVRDGKAARVPVVIRQRNADSILVEAELTEGEDVITEGVQTLRDGAAVDIVPSDAARAAAAPAETPPAAD